MCACVCVCPLGSFNTLLEFDVDLRDAKGMCNYNQNGCVCVCIVYMCLRPYSYVHFPVQSPSGCKINCLLVTSLFGIGGVCVCVCVCVCDASVQI